MSINKDVKMLLYRRVFKCCVFIALVLTTFKVLSPFLKSYSDYTYKRTTSRIRSFTKNANVNVRPRQTMPPEKEDHGTLKESYLGTDCSLYSSAYNHLIQPDEPTNLTDWTYKTKRNCPQFVVKSHLENIRRVKYSLNCSNNTAKLVPSFTNSSEDIHIVALNNTCLASFVDNCCNGHVAVPNIVHYVWYFHKEMEFYMFLSMLSVIRFIKPCLILFHGEFLPHGKYWNYIVNIYPKILHIKRPRPLSIFGKKLYSHTHSGDIMRIEAVKILGGIYLDADVIVLRDLEPLREHDMTLCSQENKYLHSAFVMAKKNATFLNLWMEGYRKDYRNESYVYNAMVYTKEIAKNRTDLIHVENGTLCAPQEMVDINKPTDPRLIYNWSHLYAYHLYIRKLKVPKSWDEKWIRNFNTTIGSMVRHVVYGNKELCD